MLKFSDIHGKHTKFLSRKMILLCILTESSIVFFHGCLVMYDPEKILLKILLIYTESSIVFFHGCLVMYDPAVK
jgi:hypothetical protein